MQKLYEAENMLEAQLLSDYLAANHIQNMISGVYLQGAMGELPLDARPRILVADDGDMAIAQKRLAEFFATHDSPQPWYCAHCGEKQPSSFDICWHCGNAR